jgi:hypothetical protein
MELVIHGLKYGPSDSLPSKSYPSATSWGGAENSPGEAHHRHHVQNQQHLIADTGNAEIINQ